MTLDCSGGKHGSGLQILAPGANFTADRCASARPGRRRIIDLCAVAAVQGTAIERRDSVVIDEKLAITPSKVGCGKRLKLTRRNVTAELVNATSVRCVAGCIRVGDISAAIGMAVLGEALGAQRRIEPWVCCLGKRAGPRSKGVVAFRVPNHRELLNIAVPATSGFL